MSGAVIDLALVLLFIGYAVAAGLRARKVASQSPEEYFLAGRTLRGWQAGFSMAATQFAADTPLLVTGLIATGGLFMLWRLWIYGLAFLAMAAIFAALWHRSGVLTDAALAEQRYGLGGGALALRTIKALYFGTLINCAVLAMVLVATLRITEQFLPWSEWLPAGLYEPWRALVAGTGLVLAGPAAALAPDVATANNVLSILLILAFTAFYSLTGGLRSVVRTDVVQLSIALLGTLVYAVFVLRETGGLGGLLERLQALYGTVRMEQFLALSPPEGTAELVLAFGVIIALQWFYQMNSDGTGYLAQRAIACRSERDARIACATFAWLQIVLRSLVWIVIGIGLLAVYPLGAAGDGAAAREATFVSGIDALLPPGARGLMLIAMLAALTSTIDTHLNWGAAYWSHDLYGRLLCNRILGRTPSRREEVLVGRLAGVGILALALVLTTRLDSIADAWSISLIFGAGIGPALVARWLWERANVWSEIGAMAVSLLAAPLVLAGLEADWQRLAAVALLSTAAVVAAGYFAPATPAVVVDGFYRRIRPPGWWREAARRAGEPAPEPMRRLGAQLLSLALAAGSLFLVLVGAIRLLLQPSTTAAVLGVLALAAGAALVPLWWRRIVAAPSAAELSSPSARGVGA